MSEPTYGTIVVVPRAVLQRYGSQPFDAVVAAAKAHADGLRIAPTFYLSKPNEPGWDDWDAIAFVREGDRPRYANKTFLLKQNW